MENKFELFKRRIDQKISIMDANISYMKDGLDGFHDALNDFKGEFDLFIDLTSENFSDHERRIAELEKKIS